MKSYKMIRMSVLFFVFIVGELNAVTQKTAVDVPSANIYNKSKLDKQLYAAVMDYDTNRPQSLVPIWLFLRNNADPNVYVLNRSAFELAVLQKKDPSLIRILYNGGGKISDTLISQTTGKIHSLLLTLKEKNVLLL